MYIAYPRMRICISSYHTDKASGLMFQIVIWKVLVWIVTCNLRREAPERSTSIFYMVKFTKFWNLNESWFWNFWRKKKREEDKTYLNKTKYSRWSWWSRQSIESWAKRYLSVQIIIINSFKIVQKQKWGWKQTISWCEGHPNVPPFKGKSRHFGESTHNSTGRGERISMMPDYMLH